MSQGTTGYSMGAAIARVLADEGINARVQPAAGTSAYLPLLAMGELDLGIANAIEVREALAGEGSFKGRKLDTLRAVSIMFPFRVGVFVRADSNIKTIADLKGKRLAHGYTSQVTLRNVLNALIATGGLSEQDVVPVMVPNVVRGADTFASGRADAAFFAIGSGKISEVDAAIGGLRFLPIPEDPRGVARMQSLVPEAYVDIIQPGPETAGIDEPIRAVMYDYVLAAGAHVPGEVIAQVVKALHANKDKLVASFGGFRAFYPEQMVKPLAAEWHEGAQSAYQELGLWPETN